AAAVCSTSFPQLGTLTIGASYSGDANSAGSKGTMQLTVGKATALIALSSTPVSPSAGTPVTITATVTGMPGLTAPGGSVAFSDGTATLGSAALGNAGRASLTVPTATLTAFTAGTHNIGAVYSGDANYISSTAPTLALVVSSKPATTTVLSA